MLVVLPIDEPCRLINPPRLVQVVVAAKTFDDRMALQVTNVVSDAAGEHDHAFKMEGQSPNQIESIQKQISVDLEIFVAEPLVFRSDRSPLGVQSGAVLRLRELLEPGPGLSVFGSDSSVDQRVVIDARVFCAFDRYRGGDRL